MEINSDIYLVSCVAKKLTYPADAQDIYISPLFIKLRQYMDFNPKPWRILSAKYGLLHPKKKIEPYEKTLNTIGINERRAWAQSVLVDVRADFPNLKKVTFLAGVRYREFLVPTLDEMNVDISIPMKGLQIGKQLSWLSKQIQ